jgi:hypothetical protein
LAVGSDVKRLAWLILCGALALAPARSRAQPLPSPATAAAPADRAPRAYAVSLGGAYAFSSRLPLKDSGPQPHPAGALIGTRVGWQVRGLAGGAPATVGFETDFLLQPARRARNSYALIYGLFVKHSFSSRLRVRPYFSYGLGAAQVWVTQVGGRGIGHATRIAFGVDTRLREGLHLSVALTYQGIMMPSFALADRPARDTSFHACVISTGVWFGP